MDTDSDSESKANGYIVVCRTFHIAQTWTQIPSPYFCVGQESESESVPESISGNVRVHLYQSENESESDVASDLLHCLLFVCLYYSDSKSEKDQRKNSLSL